MMMLRRNGNLVLGFTDENLLDLMAGRVIRLKGQEIGEPELTVYVLHGSTNEQMRADLIASGYDIDKPTHDEPSS